MYYSSPARLPVAGELFKEAIELLRWYLQGLIATHGDGVQDGNSGYNVSV